MTRSSTSGSEIYIYNWERKSQENIYITCWLVRSLLLAELVLQVDPNRTVDCWMLTALMNAQMNPWGTKVDVGVRDNCMVGYSLVRNNK